MKPKTLTQEATDSLLAALLKLTRDAEALAASRFGGYAMAGHKALRDGFKFTGAEWFGLHRLTAAEAKRYRRALQAMEAAGIVELLIPPFTRMYYPGKGKRREFVKFTPAGRAAAERLEAKRTEDDTLNP